jgi:peptidoglycan/LPS O-acetylase OafA/YrhL
MHQMVKAASKIAVAHERLDIKPLTGARGVAASAVIVYHLIYLRLPDQLPFYVFPGYLAVDMFFLLSGFVMALSYVKDFKGGFRWNKFRDFISKRFSRIYPIYVLLIIATCLLAKFGIIGGNHAAITLLSNLALVQDWGLGYFNQQAGMNIIGAAWSISCEAMAYLLFPLLLGISAFAKKPVAVAAGIVCMIGLVSVAAFPGVRGPLDAVHHAHDLRQLARCLCEFTLGLLLWRIWSTGTVTRRVSIILEIGSALGIIALLFVPGSDLLLVGLLAVLVLSLAVGRGPVSYLLSHRSIVYLGKVSYSLYLAHDILLRYQDKAINVLTRLHIMEPVAFADICIAGTAIAGAAILHHYFEIPMQNWLRSKSGSKAPSSVATEPAAP